MESRTLTLYRNVVIAAFFLTMLAGVFLPIYSDEVGWRFQERAAFDGFDKLFIDTCGLNTMAVPPFFMMPARYYSAFFNSHFADPMYIRFSSIGYAIAWGLLLLWLVKLIARDQRERSHLTLIGIGLMNLGMMPLLLIWSRPEQPILIMTTAAIVMAFAAWQKRDVPSGQLALWAKCLFIAFCGIVSVSYHFKGLIVYPALFACLWAVGKGHKAIMQQVTSGLMLLVTMFMGAQYWLGRLQCPDDPVLKHLYGMHNISYQITGGSNWLDILSLVIRNFRPDLTLGLVTPMPEPMSAWVYRNQISTTLATTWYSVIMLIWTMALLVSLVCLVFEGIRCVRNRKLEPKFLFALFLFGPVAGWSTTQLIRNVYEVNLLLPLLMMACLLALSTEQDNPRFRSWTAPLAYLLGAVALVSPVLVGTIYAPSLADAFSQRSYIREQPYSLSLLGYSEHKPDILAAAKLCKITDKPRPRALVVDDLTYFTFMDSYRPQHRLGVMSKTWSGSMTDPVKYLKSINSDGIIVACHLLDDSLRGRAKRVGQFCCLGPPDW